MFKFSGKMDVSNKNMLHETNVNVVMHHCDTSMPFDGILHEIGDIINSENNTKFTLRYRFKKEQNYIKSIQLLLECDKSIVFSFLNVVILIRQKPSYFHQYKDFISMNFKFQDSSLDSKEYISSDEIPNNMFLDGCTYKISFITVMYSLL